MHDLLKYLSNNLGGDLNQEYNCGSGYSMSWIQFALGLILIVDYELEEGLLLELNSALRLESQEYTLARGISVLV